VVILVKCSLNCLSLPDCIASRTRTKIQSLIWDNFVRRYNSRLCSVALTWHNLFWEVGGVNLAPSTVFDVLFGVWVRTVTLTSRLDL
jgi:hypothetical protein